MIYRCFLFVHRWIGLLMAMFLVVVGLTGTLLTFQRQIDRFLNPQFFADGKPGQALIDPFTLAIRAEQLAPQAMVTYFEVEDHQAAVSMRPRTNPATGKPYQLNFGCIYFDPYTGRELTRCYDTNTTWRNEFVNYIYGLHTDLMLRTPGFWILRIVALVWTLDCFVGLYLTFPRSKGAFWKRWRQAWQVKWRASRVRLNFDLHRAGGLWFWLMLLIFAWSSVMLEFNPVYTRATKAIFDYQSDDEVEAALKPLPIPLENPKLGWREAEAIGEHEYDRLGAQYGFKVTRLYGTGYDAGLGIYFDCVRTTKDIRGRGWDTTLWIDGNTGDIRHVFLASGQHTGNTISVLLWGLHYGDIRDFLPYRLLVTIFGVVLSVVSVTGVYIWWKKRRARTLATAKMRAAPASSPVVSASPWK